MDINVLDQQVSVSGQITPSDVVEFANQGIEVLVCNRPDNEAEGQPAYQEVAIAAQAAGLNIVNIPFSGGQMQPEQVDEFAKLLAGGQRIHAYCRTGNRSSQIWAAATQAN